MRADQALVRHADSTDTVLKSMYVKQELANCDLCGCGFQSPTLHADEDQFHYQKEMAIASNLWQMPTGAATCAGWAQQVCWCLTRSRTTWKQQAPTAYQQKHLNARDSENLLKINEFFMNYNYKCTLKYYFFMFVFLWVGLGLLLLLFVFRFVSWFLCVGLAVLELAL